MDSILRRYQLGGQLAGAVTYKDPATFTQTDKDKIQAYEVALQRRTNSNGSVNLVYIAPPRDENGLYLVPGTGNTTKTLPNQRPATKSLKDLPGMTQY